MSPAKPIDLWEPRDVTPKALRGRGVRVVRRFTGFTVNPVTHRTVPRYRWRVQVEWVGEAWRTTGTYPRLRRAVEAAHVAAPR